MYSMAKRFVKGLTLGLALLPLIGCDSFISKRLPGQVPIEVEGVDTDRCSPSITVGNETWSIELFGMYISQPELRIDGRWQPVSFVENEWQTKQGALLVFAKSCEAEDGKRNTSLHFDATDQLMRRATNLRFTIGLPFDLNHITSVEPDSILHHPDFFHSVQQGHAFLRLNLRQTGSNHEFSFALGSYGCDAYSTEEAPVKACQFTNRVEVFLPMNQLDEELDLRLSMASLIAQVDLNSHTGCVFESPEVQPCEQLLQNLLTRPWLRWEPIY